MNNKSKKVLLAMSGGIDSSVAAYMLKNSGFDVVGITMKFNFDNGENDAVIQDAIKVCNYLNIKHVIANFEEALTKKVISSFINDYKNGITPNPCINCNELLKFDLLFNKKNELKCDYFSTGHYAKIIEENGKFSLKKAKDNKKDQSYFLYRIKYDNLKSILFPLGNYLKNEVKLIAKNENIPTAEKKESQDICFIPDKDTAAFLKKYIPNVKYGEIIDLNGKVLGTHKGYLFYTIGQRNGLGISAKKPLYVKDINPKTNTITVCEKEYLFSTSFTVKNWNSLDCEKYNEITGKIRYASTPSPCKIETINNSTKKITFLEPQLSITKGQSFVAYHEDKVIGGGFIKDILI